MTVTALLAFVGGLLPLIVAVMEAIQGQQARERAQNDAVTRHSISELHLGGDRVHQPPAV